MRMIFWAGDSLNTTNKAEKYPQTGIAQTFDRYTRGDVVIYNHSINGRSTKSFIEQGRLSRIAEDIREGDFLFIQFAHNDEKESDPARYTDPHGQFVENLGTFIAAARDKKAYPVLITPAERRLFTEDGNLLAPSAHEEYVKGIFEAGEKFDVPVINLWARTREFLETVGDEGSRRYYMHFGPNEYANYPEGKEDDSHLRPEGALAYGRLLAEELENLGDVYAELIRPTSIHPEADGLPDRDFLDEKKLY